MGKGILASFIFLLAIWVSSETNGKNNVDKRVSVEHAKNDIDQLSMIIDEHSSFALIKGVAYRKQLENIKNQISKNTVPVSSVELSRQIASVVYSLGDRHARVSFGSGKSWVCKECRGYFPIPLAFLEGKILALKALENDTGYQAFDAQHPYLEKINGMPVFAFVERFALMSQSAPNPAKQVRALQELGYLPLSYLLENDKSIELTLASEEGSHIVKELGFTDKPKVYKSMVKAQGRKLLQTFFKLRNAKKEVRGGQFTSVNEHGLAYVQIPKMLGERELGDVNVFVDQIFGQINESRALVIDLRGNTGGSRKLIKAFSRYLIPNDQSPLVTNIAYGWRGKEKEKYAKFAGRMLYQKDSSFFNNEDRAAIDLFDQRITKYLPDSVSNFGQPYYTVLRGSDKFYDRPVYILIDEHVFSAASIFVSMFKGLPNVTVAGETADGSSGMSEDFVLAHSGITVKLSTMLSFQKSGTLFDGTGIEPDIRIKQDLAQVYHQADTQLLSLLSLIEAKLSKVEEY